MNKRAQQHKGNKPVAKSTLHKSAVVLPKPNQTQIIKKGIYWSLD